MKMDSEFGGEHSGWAEEDTLEGNVWAEDIEDIEEAVDHDQIEPGSLHDVDWFGAEVRKDLHGVMVRAVSEDGAALFVAGRARLVVGRVAAVAGGVLACFVLSVMCIGIASLFGRSGNAGPTQDVLLVSGLIGSIFLAWGIGVRLTPVRPIVVFDGSDEQSPRLAIGPTRRYRLSSLTLVVVDRHDGVLGFLKRESHAKVGWSGFGPDRQATMRVDRRGGPSVGMRALCWIMPPLGVAVMLASVFSRPNNPLAIRSGDGKTVYGSIRPMRGLKGTIEMNLDEDPDRVVERALAIAAALAVTMYE